MDNMTHDIPPAYAHDSVTPGYQWRIRNARYRSAFSTVGRPQIFDFRQHLDHMKDLFSDSSRAIGSPAGLCGAESQVLSIEYSQAFNDIAHLICEYQACLQKIKPLLEEDVLFLLLSRYAQTTGVGAYLEIRRPGDIQIYDSELREPYYTAEIQDHLIHTPGVLNVQIPVTQDAAPAKPVPVAEPLAETPENTRSAAVLQNAASNGTKSTVTVNFPAMHLACGLYGTGMPGNPPAYSALQNQEVPEIVTDAEVMAEKLHPPSFRFHQCHHSGVEYSSEDDSIELPVGMHEAVQHMSESSERFYHIGFFVGDRSRQCSPMEEGKIQAFKCLVVESNTWVYLAIERAGDMLAYNCFKDEEIWAKCHPSHVECHGCSQNI